MNELRLKKLRQNIPTRAAIFLSKPTDIFYLTSFGFLVPEEREAFLLVTKEETILFHHSFSPVTKLSFCQYVTGLNPETLSTNLGQIIKKHNLHNLLVDKNNLVVSEWEFLQSLGVKLEPLPKEWLEQAKAQKDEQELAAISKAGKISAQAFLSLKSQLKAGQTEIEVANKLEEILKKLGSEKPAFPTIVAFGENTALPHHQPTTKKLDKNLPVLIDFGATFEHYRSDMTRSWWFGDEVDPEYEQISKIVLEAYHKGLEQLKTKDLSAAKVDQVVRTHINSARYGQYFIHTTGHGLGLDIHEAPSLYLNNPTLLANKTALTIEPGIYLPKKFGFRYENTLIKNGDQVVCATLE